MTIGVLIQAQNALTKTNEKSVIEEVELAYTSLYAKYLDAMGQNVNVDKYNYINEEGFSNELDGTGSIYDFYVDSDTEIITFKYASTGKNAQYNMSIDANGKTTATIVTENEGERIKINESNWKQYLGQRVRYTPGNVKTNTSYGTGIDGTNTPIYRIFYYDDTLKSVYLKADCDDKNITFSSMIPSQWTKSSDNYAVLKELNTAWSKKIEDKTTSVNLSNGHDKAAAWISDPEEWKAWKDGSFGDNIKYVVGGPSLDMYVKSYNAFLEMNENLVTGANGNPAAKKLACKVGKNGNLFGYYIGFKATTSGGSDDYSQNNGLYQAINSLFSGSSSSSASQNVQIAAKMYNPENSRYYWFASPAVGGVDSMMRVHGTGCRIGGNSSNNDSYAFCPIVSINSSVVLNVLGY